MSLNLEVPLIRTTGNEVDMGQVNGMQIPDLMAATGKRLPDTAKNYADDASVMQQCAGTLHPLMNHCMNDRMALENEWKAITRMEWMVHDEGQKYKGKTNAYLPIFARIHHTLVSSLSRGLFPSDEYMDVINRNPVPGVPDLSKAVKTYLQWEFERVGQVRKNIKPFLRSLSAYGNGVLKYWYDKEPRIEGRMDKAGQASFANYGGCYEGLRVSPRNLFHWYIWPYTADGVDTATLVFENITVPLAEIVQRCEKGQYKNKDMAINAPRPPTHENTETMRMTSLLGLTTPQASPVQANDLGAVRVLSECWTFLVLPNDAYLEGETKGTPVAVKVVMAGSVPVEVRRNPFYHQRPPYLFSRLNAQPALIYGYGNGRLARHLQYLANDFANQTADVGQYGLNPVTVINPTYLAGPLRPLSPGVTWYMTDVDQGVKFQSPDWELTRVGQEMMQMYLTMTQDLSGAPPILQGSGGGGAKTATGSQILQNNAMQPLQDIVEDIELDVLVPLMFGTWMNAQQYRDKAVMAQIGGMPPMQIAPEMLAMDPEFRWMASSQAANQSMRAQQLMNYMTGALLPSAQLLGMRGVMPNPQPILERILVDGFGMRLPPDLFQAMPMPGMPSGAPGAPPGQQGEMPDGNARSAVEQANGMPEEAVQMAPGEGEAFGEVRNQADDLAAQTGGSNGKF